MNIAIVADSKQAAHIMAARLPLDEVFSLCPSAAYALRKAGYRVATCADYYGSLSHAKTALLVTKHIEIITTCGAECFSLAGAERSGFRANLLYILSSTYYFYFSTRHLAIKQARFYFAGKYYNNFDAVFAAFLNYALRRYNHTYENTTYSSLHYIISKVCNGLTYALAGAKNAVRVVHFGQSALTQIEETLSRQPKKLWVFRPRTIGKTILQTLSITWCNLKVIITRNGYHLDYFRGTRPSDYTKDFSAQTALFSTKLRELNIHFPHALFLDRVVGDSGWYMSFLKAQGNVGINIVRDLAPHIVMTNKGKYHFIRSAVAHLDKYKGVGVLINHGTHTAQSTGTISQIAANLWGGDDRVCFHNVSYVVPRLPLTAEQVKQIYAPNLPECITLPTVKKIKRCFANPQAAMKIMFAGNYVGPMSHTPWCTETADEYLLNILALVEIIGAMDRVEFIIKLKARKASEHMAIIQERIDLLGVHDKVRIDTDTKFLDALADTHVVISNLSTTIEEALTNRVPVVLHTHRKHYFHLPDNHYVYGVKRGQNLATILENIRSHYQHIVADDAALTGIVWQDSQYNNLQDFAAHITQLASV